MLLKPLKVGNSHYKYIFLQARQCISRPITQNTIHQALFPINAKQILIDNCNQRKDASSAYPPKLLPSITWVAIKQFQSHLAKVTSNVEYVYKFCGFFIIVLEITRLKQGDFILQKSILSHTSLEEGLDSCEQAGDHFYFYENCVNEIWKSTALWLASIKKINTYTCHGYLPLLQDVMLVEKTLIAHVYPIITIIKLRSSSFSVFTTYLCICGHSLVLLQ